MSGLFSPHENPNKSSSKTILAHDIFNRLMLAIVRKNPEIVLLIIQRYEKSLCDLSLSMAQVDITSSIIIYLIAKNRITLDPEQQQLYMQYLLNQLPAMETYIKKSIPDSALQKLIIHTHQRVCDLTGKSEFHLGLCALLLLSRSLDDELAIKILLHMTLPDTADMRDIILQLDGLQRPAVFQLVLILEKLKSRPLQQEPQQQTHRPSVAAIG